MHIKQMLTKARSDAAITPVEARDAMLGCFVTIHGETLKRGAALFLLTVLSILFMLADKGHYEAKRHGVLSDQDQLIQTLSDEAEHARQLAEEIYRQLH